MIIEEYRMLDAKRGCGRVHDRLRESKRAARLGSREDEGFEKLYRHVHGAEGRIVNQAGSAGLAGGRDRAGAVHGHFASRNQQLGEARQATEIDLADPVFG
jgi:hypothetical protein